MFSDKVDKWKYAQKVYDCTAYDDKNINEFVPQKVRREPNEAYEERKKLLDPRMDFPTGIDSLVGIFTDNDEDMDLSFGELGDPDEDPDSTAGRLVKDADGEGSNWSSKPQTAAVGLTLKNTVWGLVDGRPKDNDGNSTGEARVHVIKPESVVNWFPSSGPLEWVLVNEKRDTRQSFKDDPELQDVFIEYRLDGWRRFKVDDEGGEVELSSGTYQFFATTDKNQPILPIFPTEINIPRMAGYNWARKSNSMQNFSSRLDMAHMTITFAILQIALSADDWDDFVKKFKKGNNVLRVDPDSSQSHQFVGQSSDYFSGSEKRLQNKLKNFVKSMFRDYGDAAKKTATQIHLESKSGIEAYLSLLVDAVDEFENNVLWRLEQIYFPEQSAKWGEANVSREGDFSVQDIQKVVDNLVQRYIPGGKVPVPVETMVNIIRRILDMDNIELGDIDEGQIRTLAEQLVNQSSQETDLFSAVGLS